MVNISLREFQRGFAQTTVSPNMEIPPLRSAQSQDATLALVHQGLIIPGGRITSPEAALQVYSRAYQARLTEALGETFEAVWSVLGDGGFFRLAAEYIAAVPSGSYNLGDYGASMPSFIAEHEVVQSLPFLPDLALFEWKFARTFHAPAPNPAMLNLAGAAIQASSRLRFSPSVQLLHSHWAVFDPWQQRQSQALADFDTLTKESYLLLYKSSDERIWVRSLAPWEYHLVQALMDGISIEVALDRLSYENGEITESLLTNFFAFLTSSGIIAALID